MAAILSRPQCDSWLDILFLLPDWLYHLIHGLIANFSLNLVLKYLRLVRLLTITMTPMSPVASQITSLTVVYSTVYSEADQRKHQSSASLAFVWGIHRDRWIPRTKGQLRGKCFHLMTSSCLVEFDIYPLDGNTSLIARFMGPTQGPSGADRTQVGPMLAPWTLLSGILS